MKKTYEKPFFQTEEWVADQALAAGFDVIFSDGEDIYDDFEDEE